MDELKQKLESSYVELQSLDMKPTLNNMTIVFNALSALKEAYEYIDNNESKKKEVGKKNV